MSAHFFCHSVREIAMHIFIRVLEVVFLIGVAGCAATIPMAAWGYCSVLFEKDTELEPEHDEEMPSAAD